MNLEALTDRLEVVIRDNEAYIVAASAERAERNINAEIRQEQDAAFQETLRLDQVIKSVLFELCFYLKYHIKIYIL